MKLIIYILFLGVIFSCSKTEKEESKLFISKNNFIVSDFNKKLDSLAQSYIKNDSLELPIPVKYDKRLNKNYSVGNIHFIVLDENTSYYIINSLEPNFLICGNEALFSQQDSIHFIEKNNKLIDKSQPIKTSEITKILRQNQKRIVNTERNILLNISFAFKSDTLQGPTMYNIIHFMENNGMKIYTIRRINDYELQRTKP